MSYPDSPFTPLECAVLKVIVEMHLDDRLALAAQLLTATLVSRENTGAGFFTTFNVQRSSVAPIGGQGLRHGPQARVDGFQYGMGFILWLTDGYAECLEGYTYADSTVGIDLEKLVFEVMLG